MSALDRSATLETGNNKYNLTFPIKSLIGCEKQLERKNLIITLAALKQEPLMPLGDMFALFQWGLLGDKEYTEEEIENAFTDCMEECGFVAIQAGILEALSKSGFLGKEGKKLAALLTN